MALLDDYAGLDDLKTYLGLSDTTAYDVGLADALASVSREIEVFCLRQFNDSAAATARVYDAVGPTKVFVDDFSTTTGLIVKTDEDDDGVFETTWATTDYTLRPQNGIRNGITGWPYWEIRARANGTKTFPGGDERVQITARWGWAEVPSPVRQATLILAARTHQIKDAPLGVAGMGEFGVVRVLDDRVAAGKLKRYVRRMLMA